MKEEQLLSEDELLEKDVNGIGGFNKDDGYCKKYSKMVYAN